MKEILKKVNLKNIDKLTLLFVGVLLFSFLGFLGARYGIHNYEEIIISSKEESNINYKVYLKKNNFFEEDYLEENRTYITSLINYLDIDFKHHIELSEKLSGEYSYYVKGVVSANKVGNDSDSYWSKEYKLSDTVIEKYENISKIDISENVKINYQDYNDILTSFKNEYGLSMEGNLKVVLVVSNTVKSDVIGRDVMKKTESELNIPLTSLTIEVPIKTSSDSNYTILFEDTVYDDSIEFTISKVLGYICYFIAGVLILWLFYLVFIEAKKETIYHKKLRKILKVYDGIIVGVKSLPKLDKLSVINVSSFEELIDAHSEVRRPINFVQSKSGATFILISEGIVWKFVLNRSLFEKGKKDLEDEL